MASLGGKMKRREPAALRVPERGGPVRREVHQSPDRLRVTILGGRVKRRVPIAGLRESVSSCDVRRDGCKLRRNLLCCN